MRRQTNYPWQEPYETDFLSAQQFGYEGLGLLAMDLLGINTLASGLACTPTGPASMSVRIGPGRLYSVQNLEPTAWGQMLGVGGLLADTNADHNILKQGLYRDTTTLAPMTAPGTVGQSQNYLIQAAFSEVDAVPTSLPFVSSTPPFAPIAPSTLNTQRQDLCVITVKVGTPAATGTQTTPAPDAGNVGLWVVTIAQGQTSITSGNITAYPSAPFITETLTQKISQAFADARYLLASAYGGVPSFGEITTAGSGNIAIPAGAKQCILEFCGGGGGGGTGDGGAGGPSGTSANGTDGGDTTVNSVVAKGGKGGIGGLAAGNVYGGDGGNSGTGTGSTYKGQGGMPGLFSPTSGTPGNLGGSGGSSHFGGGGTYTSSGAQSGGYGAGGAGGKTGNSGSYSGGGGGAAETRRVILNAAALAGLSGNIPYSNGANGIGGAAGGNFPGGNGGQGYIRFQFNF